nr:MAG TPA: hypothetical protein [Inoviridae sp.]
MLSGRFSGGNYGRYSDTIYIVFLLSAIFGSLVAFAFWEIFRG